MKPKTIERLVSLDVLRGFDMFWIIGGGSLILALAAATEWGWLQPIAEQMHHVKWEGFHFEDLIFPLFMFISGVAIPYAITSKVEKGVTRKDLLKTVIKRGLTLVVFGILYNGLLQNKELMQNGISDVRFASVLGQIGLGYLFAAIIVLYTKTLKWRIIWLAGILGGIALLQLAVPVPGYGAGLLDPEGGINAWIDRMLLPGRLHGKTFDPEGLLCIVSAISVTLMGAIGGHILRDGKPASGRKSGILLITGATLIVVALLLSPFYPIIKAAWTVPFNMLTAGISFVLLSLFYYTIDVKKWTGGIASWKITFFKVIGMNSITIYLGTRIINFGAIAGFFLGWLAGPWGEWIIILGAISVEWLLLYYLYKNKIFLRV
ncbi:MAG: acyltransferase family protein [Mangrovibacterium sp.]